MDKDTYMDRGIIKWLPFDGLLGFHDLIQDLKYRLGKKDKPTLSEDQLESMNETLRIALESSLEISITYYHDGYLKETLGVVKHVDMITRTLCFMDKSSYPLDDIMRLDIL